MRMRQIATDTHLPEGVVQHHVAEQAAAPGHAALVSALHAHAESEMLEPRVSWQLARPTR